MAKPTDPMDEIVRANLIKFRDEAKLSQADAADIAGVALDNLRRYENGTTATVPGTVLSALARSYGHAVDDFFSPTPPPAKLDERPIFFLRTRPGAEIDPKTYRELQDLIDKANKDARKKTAKK